MPLPERNLELVAKNYVDNAERFYESGNFIVFNYRGRNYGGISQLKTVFQDRLLVGVIKIQQPVWADLLGYLIQKAKPSVLLEADESIEMVDRGFFYARLGESKLSKLTQEEYREIIRNEQF